MRRRPSLTPCSRAAGKPALIRSSDELLINLLIRLSYGNAGIAQLVEQLICNQQVVGSNPTAGSMVNQGLIPSGVTSAWTLLGHFWGSNAPKTLPWLPPFSFATSGIAPRSGVCLEAGDR